MGVEGMSVGACRELEDFTEWLRETRWRGLIVAHSRDPAGAARVLAGLAGGRCLHVAPRDLRGSGCATEKSPMDIDEYLGTEHDAAIVSSRGLLRPSVIASAGETVRAGGFLALAVPPRGEWSPGPAGGTGAYREYLESSIPRAPVHLWLDLDDCRVYSRSLQAPPPPRSEWRPGRAPPGVPRAVYRLARTRSQARLLEKAPSFLRGRHRSLLVVGDRGRGKSYATGLLLAVAVATHAVGRVEVVAPTPGQAQQVMAGLVAGLEASGVAGRPGVRLRRTPAGHVVRVTGPWFRVSYEPPWEAGGAPLVVIDEAAAVGVARVRRITWRSGRSIVTTTVHGYEGSGRAFVHLVDSILPRPRLEERLEEPVRYLPGDPLESWLYNVFLLDVEPEGPREPGNPEPVGVPREALAGDPGRLRRIYSVLALAHYRNTPDDILAVLESPHYRVYALESQGWPVAVALVALEEPGAPPEARISLEKMSLYTPRASTLTAARIVRIAVLPWLQRRGLGSRLLAYVEGEASRLGASVATAMFSRHEVIGFWAANGYLYYYASPRFNRVTGEKNLACAKPLAPEAASIVEEASGEFRARLIYASHSVYRDLAAEKIAALVSHSAPARLDAPPMTRGMASRLEACARGSLDPEQAMDALYLAAAWLASTRGLPDPPLGVLVAARVLQGKPHDEASKAAGVGEEEAYGLLREACRWALEGVRDAVLGGGTGGSSA